MNADLVRLYLVATPIGNLKDISYRAVDVLSNVDTVLCEDTRVTRVLFDAYGISTKLESYHAQSKDGSEEAIIKRMQTGEVFALVSDAGTPTISDPGVRLVAKIREVLPEGSIIAIPGASALTTVLSLTGFSGNQFTFYGFLPHKKGRAKIFDDIAISERVSVFYESPHRVMKTLAELNERFSDNRLVCVGRELTKIYEESPVGTARDIFDYFTQHEDKVRGEFVIVVDAAS